MSLNPIQTGKEVIDQFGRYLLTTFPIAHPGLEQQFKENLRHGLGGRRLLAKGPYVFLNRPFEQGPGIQDLIAEKALHLHPALKGLFPFETLHKHQELAIRSIKNNLHTILTTGTGSGKTEAFLLPIVDYCLHLRDEKAASGLTAVLVYPMNALVNDQLKRMRFMLAGTGIRFARYTGETPETTGQNINQMAYSRQYTLEEKRKLDEDEGFALIPWEECFSRADILNTQKTPRILLTNYNMLEYLLLRDKDLDLFRHAPLKFLVFDEVHTYTGELGSEVACLIRRLRAVARKQPDQVVCIGTSATVSDNKGHADPKELSTDFARRLFGVAGNRIEVIGEVYRKIDPPSADDYGPDFPPQPQQLLDQLLNTALATQLQDQVEAIPDELLALAEKLCGRKAIASGNNMERFYYLLKHNRLVYQLGKIFAEPNLIEDVLPRIKSIGARKEKSSADLTCEVLCYLTLGALAQKDGEPLLRPKLHYFVQGLHGVWVVPDPRGFRLFMDFEEARENSLGYLPLPLVLCKSCGQHYFKLFVERDATAGTLFENGFRTVRVPIDRRDDVKGDEALFYVTDALLTEIDESPELSAAYLCRVCGTIHEHEPSQCLNDKCRFSGKDNFIKIYHFDPQEVSRCAACGSAISNLVATHSSEVYDVHILAQSMLGAMPEEALRKLIIFADNRQDAAFQAGWMDSRSKRFRLRHILYSILHEEPQKVWTVDKLTGTIVEEAIQKGLYKRKPYEQENDEKRVKWFLLEEFGTIQQRRLGIENLGLAKLEYHGLSLATEPAFLGHWAKILGMLPEEVVNVVRLILDYYRRRGCISDSLFQRNWSNFDKEVRDGIIQTPDFWYPQVLLLEPIARNHPYKRFTLGLLANNGRSSAQVILNSAVSDDIQKRPDYKENRDLFLAKLWEWLYQHEILVNARLVQRLRGNIQSIEIPGQCAQINVEGMGISETNERYLCAACRRAHATCLPTNKCTEYHCRGTVQKTGRDQENFDVVQYTELAFVPMKTWEHSAQVPQEKRQEVEQEFKKTNGKYNCIVCTPTLELGVDIGQLEMVLMRNVPPATTNYAQRSGRAGRRHRLAIVFTYSRENSHDRYFFNDPTAMIAGTVKVPAFSMQNEPLVRKHAHSTILTCLRELAKNQDKEILEQAIPAFVHSYLGEKVQDPDDPQKTRLRYFPHPPDLAGIAALVQSHQSEIIKAMHDIFLSSWPDEDKDAITENFLKQVIVQFSDNLIDHAQTLYRRVSAYRNRVIHLNRKSETETLTIDEKKELRALSNGIDHYTWQNQDNYSLTYLTKDGFFPGYALQREGVLAQCIDPFIEIRRPGAVAVRELTPSSFVYANKKVFKIGKISFRQIRDSEGRTGYFENMIYERELDRVIDRESLALEGGDITRIPVESCPLIEIEMYNQDEIDDREMFRRRIGFNIYGVALDDHHGGFDGEINAKSYRYLINQKLRLVNLGPTRIFRENINAWGFPICPVCGAVRDPFQSDAEIEKFKEDHKKSCGIQTTSQVAIHVEFRSETLRIGPYESMAQAINVMEGICIGAGQVLDMGESELGGFIFTDDAGGHWPVYYDPVPGGTGFIPQIMKHWQAVLEAANEKLIGCPDKCKEACYSCMMHFRNQQYHPDLNRFTAEQCLTDLLGKLTQKTEIPARFINHQTPAGESTAEDRFMQIIKSHSFPIPETQYKISLTDGSYSVADFAYPEKNVLIYIDGMHPELHGNPEQRHRDKIKRAKLKMMNYLVLEITAASLNDKAIVAGFLSELAVYLGR